MWSGSSESRDGGGSGGAGTRAGARPTKSALKTWWSSNTQASTARKTSEDARHQRDLEDSWSHWKSEDEQRQRQIQDHEASQHWRSAT